LNPRAALTRIATAKRGDDLYLVMTDRYGVAGLIPKQARWAEVGVYKGDFSQAVIDRCAPSKYYLIDNWRWEPRDHNPEDEQTENFSNFRGRVHWQHFGDNANAHQEENFRHVTTRFARNPEVEVIRAESTKGIDQLPDGGLDVIYIDANHQYEYVLRDMIHARPKLKPGGLMMMDDFYEGPGGYEQNDGVMGAVISFVKRYEWAYVAASCGSFSNVALSDDPGSPFVRGFLDNLKDSEFQFVGISDVLVPNLRYKLYRKSDGANRWVPLL
jgi:hypothetical protein